MKMTLFWIGMAILGSFLTIISGVKLAQTRTKDIKSEVRKLAHPIPKTIYIDATLKFKADTTFQDILNDKVLKKIYVPGDSNDNLMSVPLSIFFDEVKFKENDVLKKRYEIKTDFFDGLKKMEIIGLAKSNTDNKVFIQLNSSFNVTRKFTSEEDINAYSSIEIGDYKKDENLIFVNLKNFALEVGRTSFSESIIDFDGGKFDVFIIAGKKLSLHSIEKMELKTNTARYFRVFDMKKDEIGRMSGTLKRIAI